LIRVQAKRVHILHAADLRKVFLSA